MGCKLRVFVLGGSIGLGLLLAFSVGGGLGLATSAQAGDLTWTGTSSASWDVSGNWYPTGVPTSSDNALFPSPIPTPPGATITLPTGASVKDITFNDSYTLSGGDLTFGGTFTVASAYTATISTTLKEGILTKTGAGTLTLSGANTYTGTTEVQAGTLKMAHANALGSTAAGTTVKTGATLDLNGITTSEPVTLQGGTLANTSTTAASYLTATLTLDDVASNEIYAPSQALYLNGQVTGPGGFTKTGGSNAVRLSNTTNNYTGATVIAGGYLDILADGVIPDESPMTVNAYVNLKGHTETIHSLTGNSSGYIYNDTSGTTATLKIGAGNTDTTYAGRFVASGGTLSIVKIGTGTLTLSGTSANTYTGTTTVQAGRLHLNKSSGDVGVVAVSGDLVISGGCVTFGNNEQIANTATVTMSGSSSALNGTGPNVGHRENQVETIAKLIITGGAFTTGSRSTWTISGQGSFTGGAGNTVFVGSSGSQISFKSLEITAMNATAGGAVGTSNSFTLYGSVSQRTTLTVGSDGLTLNGSTINLRRGTASDAAGSRVVLDGNVTTTGTSASSIKEDPAGGTIGQIGVELSSTSGTVNRTFNIGGSGADLTISIPISNGAATTAGITKTGAGTLTLSAANTYTGTTEVQAGTLKMAHANALGSTDAGTTVKTGATLDLNGITTSEPVTLQGGTLANTSTTAASYLTATLTLDDVASNEIYAPSQALYLNGQVTGSGGFTKTGGSNAVRLSNTTNNYTGATVIAGGYLDILANEVIPDGSPMTVNASVNLQGHTETIHSLTGNSSGYIYNGTTGTTATLKIGAGNTDTTYEGRFGASNGTLSIVKIGTGTLTLTGANTYTGTTEVQAGTLKMAHANALGSTDAGTTVKTGATLDLNGITTSEPVTLQGGTLANTSTASSYLEGILTLETVASPNENVINPSGYLTIAGKITGPGGFTKKGSTGFNAVRLSNSENDYTGPTVISSGYLDILANEVIPDGSPMTVNAYVNLQGHTETIHSLTGSSGYIYNSTSGTTATLKIGAGNTNTTYAGQFAAHSGTLSIVKIGPGTLTLTGANTYTGGTIVEAGRLLVNNTTGSGTGTGNVVVQGGLLGGNGTIGGAVQVQSGGTVSAGASPGHLTILGNYTQAGTLLVELAGYTQGGTQAVPGQWTTNGYDWVSVGGSAVLDGYVDIALLAGFQPATGDVFNVLTAAGGITDQGLDLVWQSGSLQPAQYWTYQILAGQGSEQILQLQVGVPEPATWLLLILGSAALALARGHFCRKRNGRIDSAG